MIIILETPYRTLSLSSVSDGTLILELRSQFCESELLINICGGII